MENELQTTLNEILQDKNTNLLPENLKKGVTCMGVNGILEPAKVLIFKNTDEMLNNTNVDINTIAVVTDTKPIQININTEIKNIYLPKQIVMDTPITNETETGFRLVSADSKYNGLSIYYSKTGISISYNSNNHDDMMNTDYKSEDGITYTQQYVNGGTMNNCYWPKESVLVTRYLDRNAENEYEPTEFEKSLAKTLNVYYDDSYQYLSTIDREYMTGIKSIRLDTESNRGVPDETISVFEPLLDAFIPDIVKQMKCYYGRGVTIFRNDNGDYLLGPGAGSTYVVVYKNGCWYIQAEENGNPYYYATLNFDTFKCNEPVICEKDWTFTKTYTSSSVTYYFMKLEGYYPISQIQIMSDGSYETNYESLSGAYWPTDDESNEMCYGDEDMFGHIEFLGWHRLLKNANLAYPYQLLNGVSGYGEHGLTVSNGSIFEHLDILGYVNGFHKIDTLYGEYNAGGKGVIISPCNTIEQYKNSKIIELNKEIDVSYYISAGDYLVTLDKLTDDKDEFDNYNNIITIYDKYGNMITLHNIRHYNTPVIKYKNGKIYVCSNVKADTSFSNGGILLYTYNIENNSWEDKTLVASGERFYITFFVDDNDNIYYAASQYDTKGPFKIYKNDGILFTFSPDINDRNLTILNVDTDYIYMLYGTDGKDKLRISKFTLSGEETNLAIAQCAGVGIDSKYVSYRRITDTIDEFHTSIVENGTITDIMTTSGYVLGNFVGKNEFDIIQKNGNYYMFKSQYVNGEPGLYNDNNVKYSLNNININNGATYIVGDRLIRINNDLKKMYIIRPDIIFTDNITDMFIIPVEGDSTECNQAYVKINNQSL